MKRLINLFLIIVFLIAMADIRPARADGFSVGAALLGGFLIGTIWAPRVVTVPPMIHGPTVQYYYPQPRYYASPPSIYYPGHTPPPPPVTICAQDTITGNINCRTIQY